MIKIKKKNGLYHMNINSGRVTVLFDTLDKITDNMYMITDRNNFLGRIWNIDDIEIEGFEWEKL